MTGDHDMIPGPVLEKASAWAFRLQSLPDDAELRAALAAWIAESDIHARAWALTQKAWSLTGTVSPESTHDWPPRAPRRLAGRHAAVIALAVAACLLVVIALPSIRMHLLADYGTSVAETRSVLLEDGSTVQLGADSAIGVAFGASARRITLLKGQAFFEVAPDPRRPFSVRSDDLAATVTGTAFEVALTTRSFAVTVATGSVRVGAVDSAVGAVELQPGQGVLLDRATRQATPIAVQPSSVAAWRKGRLMVEDAPLMDVVSALGRYWPGRIVVASTDLRGRRVTGVYDLDDPVDALRILVAPYGGSVHELSGYLTVITAQ